MLATTRLGTTYAGNVNKRAITTTIAAEQITITEGICNIVFLNSPDGKVLALGTINNW